MNLLKTESPFFISDICEKCSVSSSSVIHFISRRYLHFRTEEIKEGESGRPRKQYTYIDSIQCPNCHTNINIDMLVDLNEGKSAKKKTTQ